MLDIRAGSDGPLTSISTAVSHYEGPSGAEGGRNRAHFESQTEAIIVPDILQRQSQRQM